MSINGISSALAGLRAESLRLSTSASNIANMNTPAYHSKEVIQVQGSTGAPEVIGVKNKSETLSDPKGNDVDLASESVAVIQAETSYLADIKLLKTQNKLEDEVLDLIA